MHKKWLEKKQTKPVLSQPNRKRNKRPVSVKKHNLVQFLSLIYENQQQIGDLQNT